MNREPGNLSSPEARPYVVPFAVWIVGLIPQSLAPEAVIWAYPLRTIAAGAALIFFRKSYVELKPRWNWTALASGVLVFLLWVGLDPWLPKMGSIAAGWTPADLRARSPSTFAAWVFFRLLGSAVVVAYAEELFWRGFLLRWIIHPRFTEVPLGAFTWTSFLAVTLLFGFEHHEWASGILAGAVYAGLLYWRKNLFLCVLTHGITNFLLGLYVLRTASWHFW